VRRCASAVYGTPGREQVDPIHHTRVRLVLASSSPRRRELLTAAGLAIEIDPADIDERQLPGEPPRAYVERLARAKAATVAARHPGRVIVAADTTVAVDEEILAKPEDAADAARMLTLLSGRSHDVFTGVAVARDGEIQSGVDASVVTMRPIAVDEIDAYIASGEPMDRAGAYAIQGGAASFVTRCDGAFDTVVGLPVVLVRSLLAGFESRR